MSIKTLFFHLKLQGKSLEGMHIKVSKAINNIDPTDKTILAEIREYLEDATEKEKTIIFENIKKLLNSKKTSDHIQEILKVINRLNSPDNNNALITPLHRTNSSHSVLSTGSSSSEAPTPVNHARVRVSLAIYPHNLYSNDYANAQFSPSSDYKPSNQSSFSTYDTDTNSSDNEALPAHLSPSAQSLLNKEKSSLIKKTRSNVQAFLDVDSDNSPLLTSHQDHDIVIAPSPPKGNNHSEHKGSFNKANGIDEDKISDKDSDLPQKERVGRKYSKNFLTNALFTLTFFAASRTLKQVSNGLGNSANNRSKQIN
ncbi:MAG: hypothetical protein H0W64_00455 [Gammaproteobacteria bacterium]|nr:hypothetical protein [Gammaproteobacteria bacterium]